MLSKKKITQSIRAGSLDDFKTIEDFLAMLDYFDQDTETFLASTNNDDELIDHWHIIQQEILQRGWGDSLESKLNYHKILRENKILVIRQYLDALWTDYTEKVDEITQDFQLKAGIDVYSVNSNTLDAAQSEIYDTFYQGYVELTFSFIGILQGLINVIFFAFESSCKIISTLGCYDFTTQFARNKIIQHAFIWQTLKRMGKVEEGTKCEVCLINDRCRFRIDFGALANLYCYAIKTRMLSDYGELFYNAFSSISNVSLLEEINRYFRNIEYVINGQRTIENHCLGW